MGHTEWINQNEQRRNNVDKGDKGESIGKQFLEQKELEVIQHGYGVHVIDFEIKYQGILVAVLDMKNKESMKYRPAQGLDLHSFINYVCKASRDKVPAIVMFVDEVIGKIYAVDLIKVMKEYPCNEDTFVRIGTQQDTRKKCLQVEIPLNMCGTIKDISGEPCNIPALNQSSTTALLTSIKQGILYPYTIEDNGMFITSSVITAKREMTHAWVLDYLLQRTKVKDTDKQMFDRLLYEFKKVLIIHQKDR